MLLTLSDFKSPARGVELANKQLLHSLSSLNPFLLAPSPPQVHSRAASVMCYRMTMSKHHAPCTHDTYVGEKKVDCGKWYCIHSEKHTADPAHINCKSRPCIANMGPTSRESTTVYYQCLPCLERMQEQLEPDPY